ncbi:MAG: hypothetical protein EXR72_12925 [Myxococcales bacterium]|nr:hypothetical protein [Myxococcales bacterium]
MAAVTTQAVLWRDGVHVAGTVLWCDAGRARDLCFLSSAHHPARGAHGKVLTTARTLALLAAAGRAPLGEVLVTPFSRAFSLGATRIELFPSGALPGAASLLVDGERRVVYAGEPSVGMALAEPMEVRGAEVLVIGAPAATLAGSLPTRAGVQAGLRAAVARAIDGGRTAVVLAATPGAAAEALSLLDGISLAAHPRVAAIAEAWRGIGVALPPVRRSGRLVPGRAGEGALIWPLDLRASPLLDRLTRPWRIAATALALDPDAARRLGVDEAVPLGEHLDLGGLCSYAAHTGAREVYLTAGYSDGVARALRAHGVKRVAPLGPPRQMDLFR